MLLRLALALFLLTTACPAAEVRPYCGKVVCVLPEASIEVDGVEYVGMESRGSFVVVSPEYVLTNFHVVEDVEFGTSSWIELYFANDFSCLGEIEKVDPQHDLALIRFEADPGRGVHRIGIAKTWETTRVTVPGFIHGEVYVEINSRLVKDLEDDTFTVGGTYIEGQSGSPVVNAFGYLCGILYAKDTEEPFGYAIKVEYIREFLEDTGVLDQKMGKLFDSLPD